MSLKSTRIVTFNDSVETVADQIANAIKSEAADLAKAGYTVDPKSVRVRADRYSYEVDLEASR